MGSLLVVEAVVAVAHPSSQVSIFKPRHYIWLPLSRFLFSIFLTEINYLICQNSHKNSHNFKKGVWLAGTYHTIPNNRCGFTKWFYRWIRARKGIGNSLHLHTYISLPNKNVAEWKEFQMMKNKIQYLLPMVRWDNIQYPNISYSLLTDNSRKGTISLATSSYK